MVDGADERRSVSVFGATGSIGRQTLDLIRRQGGAARYRLRAITAHSAVEALARDAVALGAELAVVADPACHGALKAALAGTGVRAAAGPAALVEAAQLPAEWTMSAIVGAAGLAPTLAAARRGGILALANKESMVCAGELLNQVVAGAGARLLPVDSEHSAIFQALAGHGAPARIILTASGGPFRDWDLAAMAQATPEQAVAHPNWDMGRKISVDSATMFNKALEMIEAHHLFGVAPDRIEVVVHRQSIVHSLVEFADGAMLAHLGPTDMRGAIGFALNWPERRPLPIGRLDLAAVGMLSFEAPDPGRFPALRLGRAALEAGGLMGAVLNGAKEAALEAFLNRRIGFLDMARLVEAAMERLSGWAATGSLQAGLEGVLAADAEARAFVAGRIGR